MRNRVERFSLFAVALISVAISLLDITGLLDGLPFLINRTPTLSLLVLGIIVGYLALERGEKLDKIESLIHDGFDRTIIALNGVTTKQLNEPEDVYHHVAQRIKNAKRSVDILAWGSTPTNRRTEAQESAFRKYLEARLSLATRKQIRFREIMTFPVELKVGESRFQRVEDIVAKNSFNYQLRFYDLPEKDIPPLPQMILIDAEEVIIAFYRGANLPIENELRFSIMHPDIVKMFQDYYDAVWQCAKIIKEAGQPVESAVLRQVKQRIFNR